MNVDEGNAIFIFDFFIWIVLFEEKNVYILKIFCSQAKTKSIQRCCLIHFDAEEGVFDFRHYAIRVVPVGLSKAVKKFNKRKLPDLSNFTDVSEFMTK